MWGGGGGGQQSARRRAPADGGWSSSSSSELTGSSPRARCRASPSSSSSRRGRRHHSRQRRRDHGRTESVSFQHLARARATRERAGSAACGWRHVATLVVPPSKGCAAAESGGHACGAALGGAGGRPAVASGGARLAFRSEVRCPLSAPAAVLAPARQRPWCTCVPRAGAGAWRGWRLAPTGHCVFI
jgi:hypothetical protein